MSGRLLSRRSLLAGTVTVAAAGGLAGLADLAHGLYQPGVVSSANPVLFRSWASLAEAFVTRQVDAVHMLMPMAIQLRFLLGSSVRVLGWNHTNGSALTVAPDITDLGQLAGTQVRYRFGGRSTTSSCKSCCVPTIWCRWCGAAPRAVPGPSS
jgi:NitT/TauT family transport system substrate-binding protein